MTNRIKSAFDTIHAEDSLKSATINRLREKAQTGAKPRRFFPVRQFATVAALLLVFVLGGTFALYFTQAAYIDLDINPSLELTTNRFNRVIGVEAYNEDAALLLEGLSLKHKNINVALDEIIEATAQSGYLAENGLVSVTVQTVWGDENVLLNDIQEEISLSVSQHANSQNAQIDVFCVDSGTRAAAHAQQISPAKYLAILELQQVDPTVSMDECLNHTIGEIRKRTQAHGGNGHHGANNGAQQNAGQEENAAEDDIVDDNNVDDNNVDYNNGGGQFNQANGKKENPGHHGHGHGAK